MTAKLTSAQVEARLREIQADLRRTGRRLTDAEHVWLSLDHGEDPVERRERLERMWAEVGRMKRLTGADPVAIAELEADRRRA